MTATDHRAECHDGAYEPNCAECYGYEVRTQTRMLDQMRALLERLVGIVDAVAAEAPEQTAILHAIRDRMTEPRWITADAEPDEDECCDCHLVAVVERGKAVEERDKARRAAEALAEECDGLRSERAVDLDTIERLREERDRAVRGVGSLGEMIERLREERDEARTQVVSLTGERDDLRATVARVEALATKFERWPSRPPRTVAAGAIRAALGGERA